MKVVFWAIRMERNKRIFEKLREDELVVLDNLLLGIMKGFSFFDF